MVIVDDVAELLFEREWFEVFPGKVLRLEHVNTVLELVDFLRFTRHKLLVFAHHASENHYIVLVEAESKVIGDLLRHFNIKNRPNAKLGVVALDRIQEVVFRGDAAEKVDVLRATFTGACIDTRYRNDLALFTESPFALSDRKNLESAENVRHVIEASDNID